MSFAGFGKTRWLRLMQPVHFGCVLGLAALAAGITTLADSAGTQVPLGHGAVTPQDVSFIQSNIWPTGDLPPNRPILSGIYEFSDGSWRLTPYIGAGFGMADVSESLLGSRRSYDRTTIYQLRGGVALGLTQQLLGGLEYRWTNGSKPYLSLAGIPAKLEVDNRRVLLGVNYHF